MESFYLIGFAVLAVIVFIFVIVISRYFMTWLRARIANAPVSIGKMIGMSLRKVPVGLIVDNRITAVKAGLDILRQPMAIALAVAAFVGMAVLRWPLWLVLAGLAPIGMAWYWPSEKNREEDPSP